MQFKIPQDVQRQDKIVGPLTLKQLIICTAGGGIAYSLYTVLSKQYFLEIWMPPVVVVSLLTLAIAFIKIHDIPFLQFLLLYTEKKLMPQKRTWQKMQGDVLISVTRPLPKKMLEQHEKDKSELDRERLKNLHEITRMVDTHGQNMSQK